MNLSEGLAPWAFAFLKCQWIHLSACLSLPPPRFLSLSLISVLLKCDFHYPRDLKISTPIIVKLHKKSWYYYCEFHCLGARLKSTRLKELDFIGEADQGEEERQRKRGRERKTERERKDWWTQKNPRESHFYLLRASGKSANDLACLNVMFHIC